MAQLIHGTTINGHIAIHAGNLADHSLATTTYVTTQINNLIAGAPGALNTLDELAAALGDDASFATSVTNSLAGKLSLSGGTMTGKIFTVSTGTGTYDTAIELRETGYATTSQSAWGYSPAMTFHWGGRHAKRFGMRADGLFAIDDEPIALRSWVTSQNYLTSLPSHNHDDRYYTESEIDSQIGNRLYQARVNGLNVDAFNDTGLYRGSTSGWSNRPTFQHNGGALLQIDTHPSNYHSQLYFDTGADRLYFRNANAGTWGSWLTMIHSGNIGSYALTSFTETIGTGNTSGVAGAKYQINDTWLRVNSDNRQFQIYGNTRSIIYRTDGVTNDHGGGGYPHIFYYGGSTEAERLVIFGTNGDIWMRYAGDWISNLLAAKSNTGHTHDDRYYTESESDSRYVIKGSTQLPGSWPEATKFKSSGDIGTNTSSNHALQIFADDGNDAFMAFHISNDFATFFGLENSTNRLYTGGWSDGNAKYQLWDSRDFSSSNISNWDTAYGWGNHASAGYAASSHTHTFASLTSKPTTIAGYGITDAITTGNIGSQSVSYSNQVGINYNNNSNANYQLLWGSGNSVYGTAEVYVNPSNDHIYASGFYAGSDIYLGTRGTWLSSWLNQSVQTGANVRFSQLGLGAAADTQLSVAGTGHISDYLYLGGTAGTLNSWGTRTSGFSGYWRNASRDVTFTNEGYGTTWTFAINSAGAVTINRHIDANTGWGAASGNTIFVGWYGGKVLLGNNSDGGHDFANAITQQSIVSTNKHFFYKGAYMKNNVDGAEVLAVDGINGRLFTVTDSVLDTIYSVNTIAGLPILEILANSTVKIGKYGANSITISDSKIAINSDSVDAKFPFYVGDRSTSSSRYNLTNPGMGFNLADGYAQLQLYGTAGAYIDFVNAATDYQGRIMWNGSAFSIIGNMSWGGATLSNAVWNGTAISDSYISSASNWNTAFNKRPTGIAFSGGSTKTLTLTHGDGTTIQASFNDIDTDTNSDGQTLSISGSTLTISGGNSVTIPSGGMSQATADGRYTRNLGFQTFVGSLNDLDGQYTVNLDGYGEISGYGGPDAAYNASLWGIGNSSRGAQIYIPYAYDNLYFRRGAGAWSSWFRVLNTSADPYPSNMNQYVRTSDAVTFTNVYNYSWFRNYNANEGVYNQATGTHFYSSNGSGWTITGSGGVVELVFRSNHQSTIRGYVYADTSNNIGFLNNAGNWSLLTDSAKNTTLYGNLTVGQGAGASSIFMHDSNEGTREIHCNSNQIGFLNQSSSWGAWLDDGNNWYAAGALYAPIFYDSENTAFYVDPSGGSNIRNLYVGDSGSSWSDPGGWGTQITFSNGPHTKLVLQARTPGISAGMYVHTPGSVYIGSYSGHDVALMRAESARMIIYSSYTYAYGYLQAADSLRAPIFYDSNNTGYYLDPDGSSRLATINADYIRSYGNARVDNNLYLDQQYGSSIIGAYASTRYQGVFAMGDSYKLAIDGSGVSNLYGMTWSHPNAGGVAGNLNTHGLLVLENGTFLAAISGSIRARDDMRAPIFYDSQNTAYYVDPNSESNLYKFSEGTLDRNDGNSLHVNSPYLTRAAQNFRHRNGTMGWGSNDLNVIASNWGSGSFDTWSSPANGPGASSHYVGIQAMHYSNSDSARFHGWQMACAQEANNRWFWRSAWDSPRAWVEMIHSGNIGSQTVSRADGALKLWAESHPTDYYVRANWTGTYWQLTSNHPSGVQVAYADSAGSAPANGGTSSNTNSISNAVGGSYTWTAENYFRSNRNTDSSSPPLQAYSTGGGGAIMAFHRGGYYAVNFGLDSDNVIRIGGWSAGANRLQLDMSGNLTLAGDVTAFSDARVKTNVQTIENALDKTLALRGVSYNRTDSDDTRTKIGVIAQETLEVVPEVVNQDNAGMYNVSYGNMTALLIEAIKEQQVQIEELKLEVKKLRGE